MGSVMVVLALVVGEGGLEFAGLEFVYELPDEALDGAVLPPLARLSCSDRQSHQSATKPATVRANPPPTIHIRKQFPKTMVDKTPSQHHRE